MDLTGKAIKNSTTTTVLYIDILAKATTAVPYPEEEKKGQKGRKKKERKREGSTSAELPPTRSDYLYNTDRR